MNDLHELEKMQIELSKQISLEDKIDVENIRYVAGVDTTFLNPFENPTTAISCITVIDIKDFSVVETVYGEKEIDFPYIPTFLAFRELPSIMEAYKKLKSKVDVFILDGQGILHPRRMGIAAHFGVITETITIGSGKSHLYGYYKEPENKNMVFDYVYDKNGEKLGYILRVKKNTKPIFISPGNNISLKSSIYVIIKTINKYKLPIPIKYAHENLTKLRKRLIYGG